MSTYHIYPLALGTMLLDQSSLCYARNPGTKIPCVMLAFLIQGGRSPILVDTGCCGEEWAAAYHAPITIPEEMTFSRQLRQHGVSPEDIGIVINTHLHWDHCFHNDMFPHAKIYVQKKELEFAQSPLPTQYRAYECAQMGLTPPWESTKEQFVLVDGDHPLADGIELIFLPGHTPGSQGVLVDTEKGKYLIAGDAVQSNDALENKTFGMIHPSGVHVDLFEYYETLKKMENLDAHIIPGHEITVIDQKVYPN
ncbi:MAG: N-acyl homoserine lactonase family protein [Deltaproteobacteria bacterium]|nr:N-acyl homoserine lactonase family protein [Deltaproteobacteria bacterium]